MPHLCSSLHKALLTVALPPTTHLHTTRTARCAQARRRPHQVVAQPPRAATKPDEDAASTSITSSTSRSGNPLDPVFAQELLQELQDPAQLGQRGEGWTLAQFAALACVLLPPFHATVRGGACAKLA